MKSRDLRDLLRVDLAVEMGVLSPKEAAAALGKHWDSGDGQVLQILGDTDRQRVETAAATLLEQAEGDARLAVAARGVDRALHRSLPPEASQALAEAGTRTRAPLREIDGDRYVDFSLIGAGGMGVVYLAMDTELNRNVAFKMLRAGMADPLDPTPHPTAAQDESRFLQEAWVTSCLEHPNIVPVHELGRTPSGVPYYTMRLVRGERTLHDAIHDAQDPDARLALLEPFLKICDAIRFAHSRGVIHRDLKPANIALGRFGEVVVLDWGLAKVREHPDATGIRLRSRVEALRSETDLETLASALGTPGYMAPEAALGDLRNVDERSDVFSLGAILYQILSGRQAFRFDGFEDFLRKVREPVEEVPHAPSGLAEICLRAMSPEQGQRYTDAGELASAVRAWQVESTIDREVQTLEGEAEAAFHTAESMDGDALLRQLDRVVAVASRIRDLRPEHAGAEALLAQARERRSAAIAEGEAASRKRLLRRVGVAGLATATAATILVALLLDAKRREAEDARKSEAAARQLAEDARMFAEEARMFAEEARVGEAAHRKRAEELAHFMLFDLRDSLKDIGRLDLLDNVARRAVAHYESMPEADSDPWVMRSRVVALGNAADVLKATGDVEGALKSYRVALALARRLAAQRPEHGAHAGDVASALKQVGIVLQEMGDLEGALEHYNEAYEVGKRVPENGPLGSNRGVDLAQTLDHIGRVEQARGNLPAALRRFREANGFLRRVIERDPGHGDARVVLAANLVLIGGVFLATGDADAALKSLRKSHVIRQALVKEDPGNVRREHDLTECLDYIGDVLVRRGDLKGALKHYREALEISERHASQDPTNGRWQFDLSVSLDRVGNMLRDSGDPKGALAKYRASLEIRKRLTALDERAGRWAFGLALSYEKVGDALWNGGDRAAAVESYRDALATGRKLAKRDPQNVEWQRGLATSLLGLGYVLVNTDQFEEAYEVLEEGEAVHAQVVRLAAHYQGEHANWTASLRRAAVLSGKKPAETVPEHLVMGRTLYKRKEYERAAGHYEVALEVASVRADLRRGYLYNGACVAALASARLAGEERKHWRDRALEWLAEDVKLRRAMLSQLEGQDSEKAERTRAAILSHFEHAKKDADLDSLRELAEFKALFD